MINRNRGERIDHKRGFIALYSGVWETTKCMKITEKSKRALITRLINRFVSNGTKSLASSLRAISSFIFATRVIIEQGEKYQLVSQHFDETANWIYERNWQQTCRPSDKEKENIREEEANGKMFDDFRTSYFSRHFNKLLLCSTILPLQLRHVQSSRERSKIEEHGQFANQFSIKLLEFSVCVFVSENLERGNTSRLGFRLEEEEKETRLINWQIVARYSNRPRRNDSLELRLLSTFRSLCNCVGQDETPSRLYPARLIETGTTLDSLERRVVFQEAGRHRGVGNDRWNVANYWILKDRVRWSWQETRRIYKENRPKVHFVGRL